MTDLPPLSPLRVSSYVRLSALTFLLFAIAGAFLPAVMPLLVDVHDMSTTQIGLAFVAVGFGAFLCPAIGRWADATGLAPRILAMLALVASASLWVLAQAAHPVALLATTAVLACALMPMIALCNAMILERVPDRDRDFCVIRIWGSFAMIFAAVAVSLYLEAAYSPTGAEHSAALATGATQLESYAKFQRVQVSDGLADTFAIAAVIAFAVACVAFFGFERREVVASRKWRSSPSSRSAPRQLLVLGLVAILFSSVHHYFLIHLSYAGAVGDDAPSRTMVLGGSNVMTVAWISEAIALGLLPFFLKSVTRKVLLAIGIGAYLLSGVLFMTGGLETYTSMGIAVLHGVSFACFIVVGFLIVDEEVGPGFRARAQGWAHFVLLGLGIGMGGFLAALGLGGPEARAPLAPDDAWPSVAATLGIVLLWLFYPSIKKARPAI